MQNSLVPILTPSLTAKFIRVMKMMKPVLSVEATDLLAKEYTSMRALDSERGIDRANALTARAMETSIGLATAHAKSRASRSVDPEDAEAAIRLMRFVYFGSQRSQGEGEEQGEEECDGDGGHEVDTGDDDMQSSNFLSPHWPGIAKLSVEHNFILHNNFSGASQRTRCQKLQNKYTFEYEEMIRLSCRLISMMLWRGWKRRIW